MRLILLITDKKETQVKISQSEMGWKKQSKSTNVYTQDKLLTEHNCYADTHTHRLNGRIIKKRIFEESYPFNGKNKTDKTNQ